MASGDVVFQLNDMSVVSDETSEGYGHTQLTQSLGKVLVEQYQSTPAETLFDVTKHYDVIVKEH